MSVLTSGTLSRFSGPWNQILACDSLRKNMRLSDWEWGNRKGCRKGCRQWMFQLNIIECASQTQVFECFWGTVQLELHCVLHALEFRFYNLPFMYECWCEIFWTWCNIRNAEFQSVFFFSFVCVLWAVVGTSLPAAVLRLVSLRELFRTRRSGASLFRWCCRFHRLCALAWGQGGAPHGQRWLQVIQTRINGVIWI